MSCLAPASGLTGTQQASLLSLLRAVADGELLCEDARARLCEAHDFDPQRVFQLLQGSALERRGWVGPVEVYRWLAGQPQWAAGLSLETLTQALQPYLNSYNELRYDAFLRLCVPKDPARSWLKEVAMSRSAQTAWPHGADASAEVSSRLCQLLERECNMRSLMASHHRSLSLQVLTKADILRFLDAEEGARAGLGEFISPEAMRRTLVEKLRALSQSQYDALVRRLNPSTLCLIPFDELARHVLSRQQLLIGGAAPVEVPLSKDFSVLSSTRLDTSRGLDASMTRVMDTTRTSSPPPRLREPRGQQTIEAALGSKEPLPLFDQLDLNRDGVITRAEFDAALAMRKEPAHGGAVRRSGSTPLPPFARDGSIASLRDPLHKDYALVNQSWEQSLRRTPDASREFTPLPRGGAPGTAGPRTPGPAWSGLGCLSPDSRVRTGSPTRRGAGSPPRRPASPGRAALAGSSPPRRPVSPSRASSLPPGKSLAAAARAVHVSSPAPHLAAPSAPTRARPLGAEKRSPSAAALGDSVVRSVLKTMARQAYSDAQVEDSKLLLPSGLSLEAVFQALDSAGKGFVLDSDLWRLIYDFGGTPPPGSAASLVRDVQLRRRFDHVALPGQLSYREVGTLVFRAGSREYEVASSASSDADAKSELYLLKYSEPCPRCGMRVQRDADAAGCPSVTCPNCGCHFRCYTVVGDSAGRESPALSPSSCYQLFRLVDTAARCAHEVEAERSRLSRQPGFDICALSDAFSGLAGERMSFSADDLRYTLARHAVPVTEAELGLLWSRYAPQGATSVSFPDFVRQLRSGSAY